MQLLYLHISVVRLQVSMASKHMRRQLFVMSIASIGRGTDLSTIHSSVSLFLILLLLSFHFSAIRVPSTATITPSPLGLRESAIGLPYNVAVIAEKYSDISELYRL